MSGPARTFAFLATISCILLVTGYILAGRTGIVIAFLASFSINFFVYFYLDHKLKTLFECVQMEGKDPWGVLSFLDKTCTKFKIPVPKIFVTSLDIPLSFAIGRSKNSSSIVISKSLFIVLDEKELCSVLAHELFHIKNMDTTSQGAGFLVTQFFLTLGNAIDWFITLFSFGKKIEVFKKLLLLISLKILFIIVSKKSDYDADRFASNVVGDPKILSTALWKISSYISTSSYVLPIPAHHIFILNPLTLSNEDIYSSLPTVAKRIKKLLGREQI